MADILLNMSLAASVFILVIAALRLLLMRRLPQATFLVLWIICLFRILIPYELPSRLNIFSLIKLLKAPASVTDIAEGGAAMNMFHAGITANAPSVVPTPQYLWPLISCIWLSGVVLLAAFFITTHVRYRMQYRASLLAQDKITDCWHTCYRTVRRTSIRQSDRIISPMTYGLCRPTVVLPRELCLTEEQLKLILSHEYAHIRHFDVLTKWLLAITLCIYWFNPLIWLMYMLANRDMELSCDEYVIRTYGEAAKRLYASSIVDLEAYRSAFIPMFGSLSHSSTQERILTIMKKNKLTTISVVLALAIVLCTATVFATSESKPQSNNDNLLAEYERYGIAFDNNKMLYEGQVVRYFWDGYYIDSDRTQSATHYEYLDEEGVIDVHTVRGIIDNKDGSIDLFGPLISIESYSQKEFDERDIEFIKYGASNPVTYAETGDNTKLFSSEALYDYKINEVTAVDFGSPELSAEGRTFDEIFAQYEDYGLTYEKLTGGTGNVYFRGNLVKVFIDASKNGTFSFHSFDEGELIIRTVYDEAGKLTGLESE